MKASELNGTHLGTRVTVTEGGNSIVGTLRDVAHRANVITDETFGGQSFESIGASWVALEFLGGFTANCTPKAEVTIHDCTETTNG